MTEFQQAMQVCAGQLPFKRMRLKETKDVQRELRKCKANGFALYATRDDGEQIQIISAHQSRLPGRMQWLGTIAGRYLPHTATTEFSLAIAPQKDRPEHYHLYPRRSDEPGPEKFEGKVADCPLCKETK